MLFVVYGSFSAAVPLRMFRLIDTVNYFIFSAISANTTFVPSFFVPIDQWLGNEPLVSSSQACPVTNEDLRYET